MIHLLSLPPILIPFVLPDPAGRSTNRYAVRFNGLTDYQAGAVRMVRETATTLGRNVKKERTLKRLEERVDASKHRSNRICTWRKKCNRRRGKKGGRRLKAKQNARCCEFPRVSFGPGRRSNSTCLRIASTCDEILTKLYGNV